MTIMKTGFKKTRGDEGFTLLEMVGVLAICAILAALLAPRVFASIDQARVGHAVVSYNSLKSAATSYFTRYSHFGGTNGTAVTLPMTNWDARVLFPEGLVDRPFHPRIGVAASVQLVAAASSSYDLDGNGASDTTQGGTLVECKLSNVNLSEAFELSRALDGPGLTSASPDDLIDTKGRVKYNFTAEFGVVYLYVTHN
jgi:prepilin-type N-terminal cleavage/methylation domain-containing protein